MKMFQTFPQRAPDQNLPEDKNVNILHSKKSSEITAALRPSLAPCLNLYDSSISKNILKIFDKNKKTKEA